MKSHPYYTYFHTRNDTGGVFYIGKGKAWRANMTNRNKMWKAIAEKHGFSVHIASNWKTEKEAFDHEIFLIDCFRSMGCKLANMTDGGDGWSGGRHTEEHKQRIREKMMGRVISEETKQRMSAAAKARKKREDNVFYAPSATLDQLAEWHKKSSEAQVGRKFSEEHRAKISAAGIGRVSANKGKILSQEWREKMSVAAKGRPKSEEHKAKIKAAHVARVARFKAEKLQ
jgi:hypothetical protein